MGVVLNFFDALRAKQKEVQRKNRNDDLIKRLRLAEKSKITTVDPVDEIEERINRPLGLVPPIDPTFDLRAMQSHLDMRMQEYAEKPLGLVHFRSDEEEFPPPAS